MACRFDRNCSNIAAGKFWAARLACFFRNLKVSPVIGFCPLASPQIWTAVSISAPCSRGNHCIFPPAHIPQPPSTPAPHEFHRCWFAAKPNRVNDVTIPREKLVIRQAVLHAPCLGRQGRRPVEYHQACVSDFTRTAEECVPPRGLPCRIRRIKESTGRPNTPQPGHYGTRQISRNTSEVCLQLPPKVPAQL